MDDQFSSRLGTLRQLEIFLKVAEHRSMARASEDLHLSQSAVSLQIRKLADSMGLPLHEVMGKQLYLTEAGEEVARAGRDVFAALQRLEDNLNNLKGLTAGRLSIGTLVAFLWYTRHFFEPVEQLRQATRSSASECCTTSNGRVITV